MSLNSILSSASSGLFAAQTQLDVISSNITNVNTPGYVRKVVDQQPVALSGQSAGVTVGQITRTVDQFLQQASLTATAQSGTAGMAAQYMGQAEQLFGDPTGATGYFSLLDQAVSNFSSAVQNPSSPVSRDQAVSSLSSFLGQTGSIASQIQQLSAQADGQLGADVTKVNTLLSQISQLNNTVISEQAVGGDSTSAANTQSELVDQLSSLVSITVSASSNGGVDIRGTDGSPLVSRGGAAVLSYSTGGPTAGQIQVTGAGGSARTMQPGDGELQGLLNVRNQQLPSLSQQLGEYVSQAVNQLNAAHNASTAAPPPAQLTGRNTGLDLPTAISDFTGKTNIAIVDSSGALQTNVAIDFSAGTMTVDGGAPASFTPSSFLGDLNGALGANGSASFNNGVLSLQANNGDGVSIGDDPTTPARDGGQGFSQFFGLNDLVTSSGISNYNTGLKGSDPNGFDPGGLLTLRMTDASGATLREVAVTTAGSGDMNALLSQLNANGGGVGLYGSYSLNGNGAMVFTPSQAGVSVSVVSDTTQRGAGGPSMTALFGLDPTSRAQRAGSFQVRSDITSNSMNLAMAQLNTGASVGQTAVSIGDARGGQLLADIESNVTPFDAAGAAGAMNSTLTNYAAQFSGSIAQKTAAANTNQTNAQAVASEASSRRASVEGVNLDQELINMTTYQQAYNASARLMQAVSQLFTTLLNMK